MLQFETIFLIYFILQKRCILTYVYCYTVQLDNKSYIFHVNSKHSSRFRNKNLICEYHQGNIVPHALLSIDYAHYHLLAHNVTKSG
jgi:hypothetical protein